MECSLPFLRQGVVGHFLCEDMCEGHRGLRSGRLLVEELRALEVG